MNSYQGYDLSEPDECQRQQNPESPSTSRALAEFRKALGFWVGGVYIYMKTECSQGKAKAVDSTGVLVLVVGGISFFKKNFLCFIRYWVFLGSKRKKNRP